MSAIKRQFRRSRRQQQNYEVFEPEETNNNHLVRLSEQQLYQNLNIDVFNDMGCNKSEEQAGSLLSLQFSRPISLN
ncbi:hypothetical protein GJ744_011951 [Endocarpon pusillum]|uniref:Uncharacterized protein n=1 Tax=Endocarpon pusillum TaxID=364733 RepID=A0A8H7E959_9EURO|nr:hypothetical protein GJ744_011951 [Endocarpon pusillum]